MEIAVFGFSVGVGLSLLYQTARCQLLRSPRDPRSENGWKVVQRDFGEYDCSPVTSRFVAVVMVYGYGDGRASEK